MFELNNFESIKIALASPEKIRKWSRGEVKKPETIWLYLQYEPKRKLLGQRADGSVLGEDEIRVAL